MQTDKQIQILLSTYNGEQYLRSQLDSYTQLEGYEHIKVLIRDDGSTDGTRSILESYQAEKDFEILLGDHIGINASYGELLKKSDPNCRYFALSDQDDIWLPCKFTLALQALSACDDTIPLLFASRSQIVDEQLHPLGKTLLPPNPPSFLNAMVQNICPGHTQVFNRKLRELLLSGDAARAHVLDWWIYLIASGLGKVLLCDECTVLHRQHLHNAVGYRLNPVRQFLVRLRRMRSGEAAQITRQLEGISAAYGALLPEPFRAELHRFLNSQQTFHARLRYALTGNFTRQTTQETLLVRFLYACGKYRIKDSEQPGERLTRVLVECPERIASVQIGVLDVLKPLENAVCSVRFRETRNIKKKDLQWCDILVSVRGSELMTEQIAREAKRLGRLLLYFLDDDLLHLPADSLARDYFTYEENQRALCNILGISDALWGVNERIREQYLSLCGVPRWIGSRISARLHLSERGKPEKLRVLYAGSKDHQKIVREVLAPAVRLAAERLGPAVDFTFIGPDPKLDDLPQAHFYPFFHDYARYRAFVENGGFSIGLAPVRSGGFFQCKYYNKFVEYTSIGAVGIYTDSPLYRQVISDGENGLLCANDPALWAEAIVRLSEQTTFRERCFQQAARLIETEFQPDLVARRFLEQFPELKNFRAPAVSILSIHLSNTWLDFYIGRAKYLFRCHGVLAVPIIGYKALKKAVKFIFRGKRYRDH